MPRPRREIVILRRHYDWDVAASALTVWVLVVLLAQVALAMKGIDSSPFLMLLTTALLLTTATTALTSIEARWQVTDEIPVDTAARSTHGAPETRVPGWPGPVRIIPQRAARELCSAKPSAHRANDHAKEC